MCHIAGHLSIRRDTRAVCAHAQLCARSRRRSHACTPAIRDLAVHRKQYVDLRYAARQMCCGTVAVSSLGDAPQGRHRPDDVSIVQSRRPLRQRHERSVVTMTTNQPSQPGARVNQYYVHADVTMPRSYTVRCRSVHALSLLIIADLAPVRYTSHSDHSVAAAVIRNIRLRLSTSTASINIHDASSVPVQLLRDSVLLFNTFNTYNNTGRPKYYEHLYA